MSTDSPIFVWLSRRNSLIDYKWAAGELAWESYPSWAIAIGEYLVIKSMGWYLEGAACWIKLHTALVVHILWTTFKKEGLVELLAYEPDESGKIL